MGRFTTREEVDHAVESAAAVEYVRAKDGKDGVQVHITNTSNLPVEAIEQEYPLRVEEYGLIENSGGAGRHRGGLGLRRVVRPVGHDCTFNGVGERFRHRPWGYSAARRAASCCATPTAPRRSCPTSAESTGSRAPRQW